MTTHATSIVCDGLSYQYIGTHSNAVDDVSFSVEPGQVAALVGPSGCGKSTLLRNVAGLLTPTAGHLLMDGRETVGIPADKRNIGWVPQSYALFGHLSVAENVEFGLRARKVAKAERAKRVAHALELCRIGDFAKRSPEDLSGGQRQRVAIARALATNPKVLLLDEPLSALDPQLRKQLRADLSALLAESGVTTLLVTHDQGEALAMADMVAVMRAGRLEQYASPQELWANPANGFVAEFVSEASVVATTRRADGGWEAAPGLVIPGAVDGGFAALRPGDLHIAAEGAKLTVTAAEYAGDSWLLSGDLIGGARVSLLTETPVTVGDSIVVAVRPRTKIAMVKQ
ncbi:putative spermidine/putrescine transport system ATP-binding protein [Stackebrandtia endophytica]|uniref:ABC-type quaternary amine transporter n=1 Tax=Stackebrandtia endophytica TaxID=1496996 RepID=A0A543B1Y4_9ACTN|nr:ABC transporter ATP-binding protein [Stackebrandtia endophytica]TQL78841.1 putative spermidine/putrescine transport system ATP-binding protein [Stackebrandtia endophytica]